jgi:hypothetical protein
MICPTCRGRGFTPLIGDGDQTPHGPCPECHGSGIASCCDSAGSATPSFTCPRCGAVSANLNDIRERYCGRCHAFLECATEDL